MKLATFFLIASVGFAGAGEVAAQRTPLTPIELTKIEYAPGGIRDRFNPATKRWEKFALDRKIVYDEPSGNFLLQWNGLDGERKTIVYRPANRLHAVVSDRAEFDSETKTFKYVYAVRNLPSSQRELQSFYLETKANVDQPESPDSTWGYSAPFTDYLRKVLQANGGWDWVQTRNSRRGLLPGESSYGFSFRSSGLPGLVKCYVAGPAGMKGVGEEPPEELMAALDPVLWLIPNGVTVGPVAAPEKPDPVTFLKEIQGMIDVGVQQGWILAPSLAEELRGALREGLTSLERKDSEAARAALEGLLSRVDEEKDKRLLSEAYALLRYNTEFLLLRIGN